MKADEQYFPVVLLIMLYKVVLTFESVDEILKCNHSNKSCWTVLSCGTVYYAVFLFSVWNKNTFLKRNYPYRHDLFTPFSPWFQMEKVILGILNNDIYLVHLFLWTS